MRKFIAWVGLFATTAVAAQVAEAQAPEDRGVEARAACASGDVDKGVKLLAQILATTDDITAVYNMGRCYQQNGMPDKAALQFREYLRKAKDLTPEERKDVEAQLREAEGEQRPSHREAVQPTPSGEGAHPAVANVSAPSGRSESRRNLRLAGIGVASLGIIGVGTGAFFGLRASALERQMEKAGNKYQLPDDKAGSRAQTLQWIFYGAGAAGLVGGALLYYLGVQEDQGVAVVPSVTPQAFGAVVRVGL